MSIFGDNNANVILVKNVAPFTQRIDVYAYGGDDRITAPSTNPSWISGGPGNDTVIGGAATIQVQGESGDDFLDCRNASFAMLSGGTGNDRLIGGIIGSQLYGGEGNDTMEGGRGADAYDVDALGDVIIEVFVPEAGASNPRDSVRTTISYVLGATLEDLWLVGTGNLNGRGNAGANDLKGNWYNNRLEGSGGNDTISGEPGADLLRGGTGRDMLRGGEGADIFDFDAIDESGTTATSCDVIQDFTRGSDRIDLSTIDARSSSPATNDAFRFIGNAAFSDNATGQVRYVYNAATRSGTVFISTDSDAAAEMTIRVTGVPALSAADFVL